MKEEVTFKVKRLYTRRAYYTDDIGDLVGYDALIRGNYLNITLHNGGVVIDHKYNHGKKIKSRRIDISREGAIKMAKHILAEYELNYDKP